MYHVDSMREELKSLGPEARKADDPMFENDSVLQKAMLAFRRVKFSNIDVAKTSLDDLGVLHHEVQTTKLRVNYAYLMRLVREVNASRMSAKWPQQLKRHDDEIMLIAGKDLWGFEQGQTGVVDGVGNFEGRSSARSGSSRRRGRRMRRRGRGQRGRQRGRRIRGANDLSRGHQRGAGS